MIIWLFSQSVAEGIRDSLPKELVTFSNRVEKVISSARGLLEQHKHEWLSPEDFTASGNQSHAKVLQAAVKTEKKLRVERVEKKQAARSAAEAEDDEDDEDDWGDYSEAEATGVGMSTASNTSSKVSESSEGEGEVEVEVGIRGGVKRKADAVTWVRNRPVVKVEKELSGLARKRQRVSKVSTGKGKRVEWKKEGDAMPVSDAKWHR